MSSEPLPPSADRVAERLAMIVDAAERAALSVIDDAEKEAKRYLEESEARADRIVAERLRGEADRLESLDDGEDEPRLRSVTPDPQDEEEPPSTEEGAVLAMPPADSPAAARLLATQMAVSGSSRGEIEMRLRNKFEIEDAGEILDAILGPED